MSEDLVLVTGASGGLGVGLVRHLLAAGWKNLACQYRTRPDPIRSVLTEHGLDSGERLFQADLTEEDQVARLQQQLRERLGSPFGLINLAGASTNRISWKMSRAEFDCVLQANLLSTFLTCRQFCPEMRERSRGRIINVSSVVAFTGVPGAAHYCAAKAAIVGFSKALALELASRNVVVSVLALGYFDAGLIHSVPEPQQQELQARIPARRFGSASEIGGLLEYLLSGDGAYAGGQVFHLNGGLYS